MLINPFKMRGEVRDIKRMLGHELAEAERRQREIEQYKQSAVERAYRNMADERDRKSVCTWDDLATGDVIKFQADVEYVVRVKCGFKFIQHYRADGSLSKPMILAYGTSFKRVNK